MIFVSFILAAALFLTCAALVITAAIGAVVIVGLLIISLGAWLLDALGVPA